MRYGATLLAQLISLLLFSQERTLIVGTYDSPKSAGIYAFRFNGKTGKASVLNQVQSSNPSYVTFSPDGNFVYAVNEDAPKDGKGGSVSSYRFDRNTGGFQVINKQRTGGDHPCHVTTDETGRWLFVSNYSGGSLCLLPVLTDGGIGEARIFPHSGSGKDSVRQKGPHVHGAVMTPGNRQVVVTDLGIDKIVVYDFNAETGKLIPANPPSVPSQPGSGPRSFCFHPNKTWGYAVEELSGNVSVYQYNNGNLKPVQRISTLKKGDSSFAGSADIHISPDGKFLYASNRGTVNNIVIYSIDKNSGQLTLAGQQSSGGKTPRNFSIDPSGDFLLCANQNSDEIVVFRRNKTTGMLSDSGNRIRVGKPVCIRWLP